MDMQYIIHSIYGGLGIYTLTADDFNTLVVNRQIFNFNEVNEDPLTCDPDSRTE